MREHTPAPAPAQADEVHTSIIQTTHPIAFNPRTDLEAIGTFVRTLAIVNQLHALNAGQLRLLLYLAALGNGKHFRATGELVSWPGEVAMGDAAGFKRSGSVYKALRGLQKLDLVQRCSVEIDGRQRDAWRILLPEPGSDRPRRQADQVRLRRGIGARSGGARAQKPNTPAGARSGGTVARAPGERALNAAHTKDLTRVPAPAPKIETEKNLNNSRRRLFDGALSGAVELADDGRQAAAAAELEGLEVSAGKINELVSLATTTRALVRAAEKARKSRQGAGGLLVWFVQNPAEIPAKFIRQAERELQPVAAPAASAATTTPTLTLTPAERDRIRALAGLRPRG